MNNISIVVPVWNEAKNIRSLVKQIDAALRSNHIGYEIIFVDDHSTDSTRAVIRNISAKYPIKLFSKIGNKGKAYSLLEGFVHAKYDLICMIDADLQYSPFAIPQMIEKIQKGADIIVGNRQKYEAGIHRKIMSKSFNFIFVRMLHGFTVDAQSGLKVFRKSVVDRIELYPSSWTFDLELLVKARNAGYRIESHNIIFTKRHAGESKIAVIKSSVEIGLSALRLKAAEQSFITYSNAISSNKG